MTVYIMRNPKDKTVAKIGQTLQLYNTYGSAIEVWVKSYLTDDLIVINFIITQCSGEVLLDALKNNDTN